MQPARQSQPTVANESRPATASRRALPLQPFDRIMLKAVSENLSHLRRNGQQLTKTGPTTTASQPTTNGQPAAKPMASSQSLFKPVANGQNGRVDGMGYAEQNGAAGVDRTPSFGSGSNRLDYNKKALSDIRQSLQNYHVPSSTSTCNQSTFNGHLFTENNLSRQEVTSLAARQTETVSARKTTILTDTSRQAAVLSGRNAVWEVAERLTNHDVLNVTSSNSTLLNVPGNSTKIPIL